MEIAEIVAIHQTLALYGHLLDDRDWERLSMVFTNDATFDASDAGGGPATHSLAELRAMFDNPRTMHPLAHHITNPYVWQEADGTVHARSKIVGILADGRAGSGSYFDTLMKTAQGWRIKTRTVKLRRESQMLRQPPEYRRS